MAELKDDDGEEPVAALSMGAQSLIAMAMADDEPPQGAEDQSWGMVISRVDESRPPEAAPPIHAQPAAPTSSRWIGAVMLGAALAVVGGLGWWVVSSGPPPQPKTSAPAPAPAKGQSHGQSHAPADAAQRVAPADAAARDAAPAAPARSSAHLLDDAESALGAGNPARALELLEQHATQAPVDPDLQRRLALRIRTLCALDRVDDAKSEAAAFLERHTTSRYVADVRASCGAGK